MEKLICILVLSSAIGSGTLWAGPSDERRERKDIDLFGYMSQYDVWPKVSRGDYACAPTSALNVCVYLQNEHPDFFKNWMGETYPRWRLAGQNMIRAMGAIAGTDYRGIWRGLRVVTGDWPARVIGRIPSWGVWWEAGDNPAGLRRGLATAEFIFDALEADSGVIADFVYLYPPDFEPSENHEGHEIAITGIEWEPRRDHGKIWFLDPLDPSMRYAVDADGDPVVLGPPKERRASFRIDEEGRIRIAYRQYTGALPYDPEKYILRQGFIGAVFAIVPESAKRLPSASARRR